MSSSHVSLYLCLLYSSLTSFSSSDYAEELTFVTIFEHSSMISWFITFYTDSLNVTFPHLLLEAPDKIFACCCDISKVKINKVVIKSQSSNKNLLLVKNKILLLHDRECRRLMSVLNISKLLVIT